MNSFYIESVGVCAPGMTDWQEAQSIFRSNSSLDLAAGIGKPAISILPPNERRRTTKTIKLAINSLQQIADQESLMSLPSVFASSCGDVDLVQSICMALAQTDKPVSPTQFHNSVHNAAAGYWSIGSNSMHETTSISAAWGTFAAGLLEAACQMHEHQLPVLLCCYDISSQPPIDQIRPIQYDFASSYLLSPEASAQTLAKLMIEMATSAETTVMDQPDLEKLRKDNPSAAALPLLQSLALKKSGDIGIAYMPETGMRLHVDTLIT